MQDYQLPLELVAKPTSFLSPEQRKETDTAREMFMVNDLAKSGLTFEDLNAKVTKNGYIIPYSKPNGELVLDSFGRSAMFRVRLLVPDIKTGKYHQPSKAQIGDLATIPYIPPASFTLDGEVMLVCEGEKKAAAAAKYLQMRAIAIGGCHLWQVNKGEVHPLILAHARAWGIKKVILVPDGDVHRYDICAAYGTFCHKMIIEGYDASVLDMAKGTKLDDLIWKQENPREWFGSLPTFTDLVENPVQLAQEYGLSTKPRGKDTLEVPPNESNLERLLERHPAFPQLWFDLDHKYVMQEGEMLREGIHDFDILTTFQHRFQLHNAKMPAVASAVGRVAGANEKSPFLESIREVQWDGVERISTWLTSYCGAEHNEYTKQVGRRWLIAAIARMMDPGCIVDFMLITKGKQGIGKSSLPMILFGVDNVVAIEGQESQHKDILAKMHMGLCANMEELSVMNGRDINLLKPMITNRIDAFRRPFRRDTVQEKRRFVIYGSTDKAFPLPDDPAGLRRFPIVEIDRVDFSRLEADRMQLWAEAMRCYESGEAYSNVDDVNANVQRFVALDPLCEQFQEWVDDRIENGTSDFICEFNKQKVLTITLQEIRDILGINTGGGRGWAQHVLKEYMVKTGWRATENGPARPSGRRVRCCWFLTLPPNERP